MALDNLTVFAIVSNLSKSLIGGRITKIGHPEKDEIYLTVRNNNINYKLIISSNSQYPLIYLDSDYRKENPKQASNFCMILRKYIQNGKIEKISQVDDDRIIELHISHFDELGDLKNYRLIVELMGKHSNIILVNENNRILDSIKHVDASTSSIRQVFPGSNYFIVNKQDKKNIFDVNLSEFQNIMNTSDKIVKTLSHNLRFVPPKLAQEICFESGIDSDLPANLIDLTTLQKLFNICLDIQKKIHDENFSFYIYYDNDKPIEYSVIEYRIYSDKHTEKYSDINTLLINFYRKSLEYIYIYDKTSKIRNVLNQNIKRLSKKLNIWETQLSACKDKEKFKLCGELLFANLYRIKDGSKEIKLENYYTNEELTIKLDEQKTPSQNAQFYYDKYNKLKRTEAKTKELVTTALEELNYLSSIMDSIKYIQNNKDITDIYNELVLNGYVRANKNNKKSKITKAQPLHYIDDDGFHYYVGKNNLQNEEVTFKIAEQNDWWFHIKDKPGSHVIVKNNSVGELPDNVYLLAASLAGYYSSESNSDKVEIDYIQRKFLKKPKNYKPGMVIYHTNYSINVTPSISNLKLIN